MNKEKLVRFISKYHLDGIVESAVLNSSVDAEKLTVSALNLFWASSKLIRVLVEFSKNRLTTVMPCKDGTFLIGLSRTSRKLNAVSIIF
jgi:hypothetical protein